MQHEPNLQRFEYVWVDALCVDQENVEKRKATIYHMNEIYLHASEIVAVPDLHASHLSATTSANRDAMNLIKKYRRYLYYLLDSSIHAQGDLEEMDHAWMDTLSVPKLDLYRRDFMTQQQTIRNTSTSTRKHSDDQSDDNDLCLTQQMMALMHKRYAADRAEHYYQVACRLMVEVQRSEWQRQREQRKNEVTQSMKFLQSIMEDWANRTWVISEYHLARKSWGSIKFWFNQLSSPELHGYQFFGFSFDDHTEQPQSIYKTSITPRNDPYKGYLEQERPYWNQMDQLKEQFHHSMRRRLQKRTILETILQSKASKTEDRFYSILPLAPKYKHHIKDKHSISSLGISDMLSVRLQLLEWLDIKDKLNLLFCAQHPMVSSSSSSSKATPLLPTFATYLKTIKPGLLKLITYHKNLNFDLDDPDSVRLNRDDGDDRDLNVLWLRPKSYYIPCSPQKSCPEQQFFYEEIGSGDGTGGTTSKIWKDVGLDPAKDTLDAVSIPLFLDSLSDSIHYDNDVDDHDVDDLGQRGKMRSNLQLVGSWAKNAWILHRFCFDYNDKEKIHLSRACDMDRLPEGFRIY